MFFPRDFFGSTSDAEAVWTARVASLAAQVSHLAGPGLQFFLDRLVVFLCSTIFLGKWVGQSTNQPNCAMGVSVASLTMFEETMR